jgi:hypothetical protein
MLGIWGVINSGSPLADIVAFSRSSEGEGRLVAPESDGGGGEEAAHRYTTGCYSCPNLERAHLTFWEVAQVS